MAVDVREGELRLDGQRLQLEHEAQVAEQLADGDILVLYAITADSGPAWKTFNNLVRVDELGEVRWRAKLPNDHGDVYVDLISTDPIIARSFSGYRCTIDAGTGAILRREFVK